MKKTLVVLFVLVLLFAHVQNVNMQVLDITMLPKLTDIQESGQIFETSSIRYLYSNGYLNVWFRGATEMYQFVWSNNKWTMNKIIKNVLPDYIVAVNRGLVSFSQDDSMKIANSDNTLIKNLAQVPFDCTKYPIYTIVLILTFISFICLSKINVDKYLFVRNIKMFVRNKKPETNVVTLHNSFCKVQGLRLCIASLYLFIGGKQCQKNLKVLLA